MADTPARQDLIRKAERRLREKGRRGLQKRPPRPRRPEGEIRHYRAALRDVARAIDRATRDRIFPALDDLLDEAGTRSDSVITDDWPERIEELARAVRSDVDGAVSEAQNTAERMGEQTREHADEQQVRQIRAVLGVEPSFVVNQQISNVLNAWKQENRAFVTNMTEDAVQEIQNTVSRGVRMGTPTKDIKNELRDRFKITDNRAQRIARTEISQLHAQATKQRQTELGIETYIWRTARDKRVRDKHEDREGDRFKWGDPPPDGHPGEPVNCRCTAQSDVTGLLDQLEAMD